MRPDKQQSGDRRPRVIWTDGEKAKIIDRAVTVQAEHPDLAGLPLLRAAMQVLPRPRHRKPIAVTQAAWFEPGVAAEKRRRAAAEREAADLVPIVRETAATNAAMKAEQSKLGVFHEAWRHEQTTNEVAQIRLLELVLRELQSINLKLGRPVPVDVSQSRNGRRDTN